MRGSGRGPASTSRSTLTEREALIGTSFTLTGATDESGRTLAWWGRAAESAFDGREGALTLDGKVTTGLVGADYGREDWLTGLVISRTDAEGSYTEDSAGSGTLASTLTAVTVYGAVDTSAAHRAVGRGGSRAGGDDTDTFDRSAGEGGSRLDHGGGGGAERARRAG